MSDAYSRGRPRTNKRRNNKQQNEQHCHVYGYFYCEECDEEFESSKCYQVFHGKKVVRYTGVDCPSCEWPILPYEYEPLESGCTVCECIPCECRCTHRCRKLLSNCRCERRCYGYYRCASCRKSWESAWTWIRGAGKYEEAMYGQQCRDCKKDDYDYHFAYDWEEIVCAVCGTKPCKQTDRCKERHSDPKKNHERLLCERCRSGRPCNLISYEE